MPIRPIALVWMGMIAVLALTVWAIDALVRERYLQARPECSVGRRGGQKTDRSLGEGQPAAHAETGQSGWVIS